MKIGKRSGMNAVVELDDFDVYTDYQYGYSNSILRQEVIDWLPTIGVPYAIDGCKLYFKSKAGQVAFKLRWNPAPPVGE